MRLSALTASPAATDATVKTTTPALKVRRRPNVSASLPPVRSSDAKLSTYASTNQAVAAEPACKSREMDGSATFTTVLSRLVTTTPSRTATKASHRWGKAFARLTCSITLSKGIGLIPSEARNGGVPVPFGWTGDRRERAERCAERRYRFA
jgi:hypothetical protein